MATINMGIETPVPGVTGGIGVASPGKSWGELLVTAIEVLDAHDHASGRGRAIGTAGISIGDAFSMNGNDITNIRSAKFSAQSGTLVGTETRAVYFNGVDLYVNDGNGSQIALTSAGAIAGTPGSISNLVSPASATYTAVSELFSFFSDVGVYANIAAGPISIFSAAGGSVTLQANAASGTYGIIFPTALPAGSRMVVMEASGNISYWNVDGTTVTQAGGVLSVALSTIAELPISRNALTDKLTIADEAIGHLKIALGAPSAGTTHNRTTGTSPLSATITATGNNRTVLVVIQATITNLSSGTPGARTVSLTRGATLLKSWSWSNAAASIVTLTESLVWLDAPSAGSITYTATTGGVLSGITIDVMNVYELA